MKQVIVFLGMLTFMCLSQLTCLAAIIHVPADQPTIQAGIDATVDGDTVLVADGTYTGDGNRDISFKGKAITVTSENGADTCIIDCENDGRGFTFYSNESASSILQGFTVTQGRILEDGGGAGLYCIHSSPSIIRCIINFNHSDTGYGGGIFLGDQSSPLLDSCIVSNNSVDPSAEDLPLGGGIYCENSTPSLIDCVISHNEAVFGGGIYLWESSASLVRCSISENLLGGGLVCESSSPSLENCMVAGNLSPMHGGGGILCNSSPSPSFVNCTISNNKAGNESFFPYYGGGGLLCSNSSPSLTNCIINGNTCDADEYGYGGGITCWISNPSFFNCIITNNNSYKEGGGIYCYLSFPSISNTIIWSNFPDQVDGVADLTYSNIQLGYPGIGNIAADPLFLGGAPYDFRLSPNSPCIDAGTDNGATTIDFEGNPRKQGGAIDMGVYEYPGWPSLTRTYVKMPVHMFASGDTASCSVSVWNAGNSDLSGYPLFAILDVVGNYYCAPSFTYYDYYKWSFPPGLTELTILPEFIWPSNAGSASDIVWYTFLMNPGMTDLASEIGVFDFGWSE